MAKTANDPTRQVLEELLSLLHQELAEGTQVRDPSQLKNRSYLMGADNQFLGTVGPESEPESLLNKYGPYGSPYSLTSIFNTHSAYGSRDGAFSINNPACPTPPRLFIRGTFAGKVTANKELPHQIPTQIFLNLLRNNVESLMGEDRGSRE